MDDQKRYFFFFIIRLYFVFSVLIFSLTCIIISDDSTVKTVVLFVLKSPQRSIAQHVFVVLHHAKRNLLRANN